MIDKKPFMVTNEQAKEKSEACIRIKQGTCQGCRYNDVKYDVCPSTYFSPELALDLLEARELIKEMREEIRIVVSTASSETTKSELSYISNYTEMRDLLKKSKDYA